MCVDPTAELQVARRKIQQLEEVNGHYKTEVGGEIRGKLLSLVVCIGSHSGRSCRDTARR